jgi:hypothetical protein
MDCEKMVEYRQERKFDLFGRTYHVGCTFLVDPPSELRMARKKWANPASICIRCKQALADHTCPITLGISEPNFFTKA